MAGPSGDVGAARRPRCRGAKAAPLAVVLVGALGPGRRRPQGVVAQVVAAALRLGVEIWAPNSRPHGLGLGGKPYSCTPGRRRPPGHLSPAWRGPASCRSGLVAQSPLAQLLPMPEPHF